MRGNDGASLPLVSTVIPTRNRPDLVARAVRCALDQTYPNLEVIVVIDGPDAATEAALRAIGDPRVTVIALARNVGGSEARNIGVRATRGEWVALLDDDDEWFPEKIQKQLALVQASEAKLQLISSMLLVRSSLEETVWPVTFPDPSMPISEFFFASAAWDLEAACCRPHAAGIERAASQLAFAGRSPNASGLGLGFTSWPVTRSKNRHGQRMPCCMER